MFTDEIVHVYRVEHMYMGTGPYNTFGITFDQMLEDHENAADEHPAPQWDGIKSEDIDPFYHYFGFTTMEQLYNWFEPEYRDPLTEAGFTIAIYAIQKSKVIYGGHQLVFQKDYGQRIEQIPLEGLYSALDADSLSIESKTDTN